MGYAASRGGGRRRHATLRLHCPDVDLPGARVACRDVRPAAQTRGQTKGIRTPETQYC